MNKLLVTINRRSGKISVQGKAPHAFRGACDLILRAVQVPALGHEPERSERMQFARGTIGPGARLDTGIPVG
ncbi:hypothetical protein V474_12920 [Novosphingobium barchaimii LL02]|uniref:Uncharacterized protein n=1 Tax=Novosphingobium barchaimii LL02 TaxID=1114963 RepID=A0A0J7Y6E0_9SPHN|nr:hypothetical protein [Novosphingobium barchaimii]KMS58928.1 hypothetical protein V474_12920 [Novosphingobium barchaimii LL02]